MKLIQLNDYIHDRTLYVNPEFIQYVERSAGNYDVIMSDGKIIYVSANQFESIFYIDDKLKEENK